MRNMPSNSPEQTEQPHQTNRDSSPLVEYTHDHHKNKPTPSQEQTPGQGQAPTRPEPSQQLNPYASLDNSNRVVKASAKYMANLLAYIRYDKESGQELIDQAQLYLHAFNGHAEEKLRGHVKTGLRRELVYQTSQLSEVKGNSSSPALVEFVLSLSTNSDKEPERFNRQDIFLGGNRALFEALVHEMTNEIGRPPNKQQGADPSAKKDILYAAWTDQQFMHLYIAAEPSTENSEKEFLKIRLSIEEEIE